MSALEQLLAADRGASARPQAHLFSGDYRLAVGESVERTVANLLAHACSYEHWIIAYSGGKDSSTVVTLIVTLLELGAVPRPQTLTVMYADTRMELPPLQAAARVMMDRLRALGITVFEVCAPMDERSSSTCSAAACRRPRTRFAGARPRSRSSP